MSRHRNVRNINIEEELESDDDADYYGKSMDEDDAPMSPGTSQFVYKRPNLTYSADLRYNNYSAKDDYDFDEDAEALRDVYHGETDHPEIFALDVSDTPKSNKSNNNSLSKKGTPTRAKPAFTIGEPKGKKTAEKKNLNATVVPPNIENLRVSESKPTRSGSKSPARMTPNSSFQRLTALDIALAASSPAKSRTRPNNSLQPINLVIVGHVDAGKSTLVGHLLYLLGNVDDKVMHKNRTESARAGKSSFAFAWLLDEVEEERSRGITMDIARTCFKSPKRGYNILDAPGHKDFIPNLITGAAQADAALLVINATRGEFETGFDQGGQTREHALLLRSLGVSKVIAVINKLDTINWSQQRFEEITAALGVFLQKQAGFEDVQFVPVSGLLGENLVERPPASHPLCSWYGGPCLIEALDQLPEPKQPENLPLRIVVNDVLKVSATTLNLSGKVESGFVETGEKVFLMPDAKPMTVKSVVLDEVSSVLDLRARQSEEVAFAGSQVLLTLLGTFETDAIFPGYVICRGGSELLVPIKYFTARIVVFDVKMPLLRGTRAELFAHSQRMPCVIVRLKCVLNKTTRQAVKENPRVLTRNMSALVEIQTELPVNIEPHPKTLCRFTLRANNQTIAAGIVDQAL